MVNMTRIQQITCNINLDYSKIFLGISGVNLLHVIFAIPYFNDMEIIQILFPFKKMTYF